MKNKILIIVILITFISLAILMVNKLKTQKISQTKIVLGRKTLRVEIAKTDEEKERGLSGRKSLCEDCGMLFIFDKPGVYPFWMRKMYFDIDIIWIRDNKVAEIVYLAKAPDSSEFEAPKTLYQSKTPIDKVLEVNAGWVEKNGIKIGDELIFK